MKLCDDVIAVHSPRGIRIEWYDSTHSETHTNIIKYEGWNFNSGNYLFTTDTK